MNQKIMSPANKSTDVLLLIDGKPVGGQKDIVLSRSATQREITNKIKLDWKEFLATTKTWNISCPGLYITNDEGFKKLEIAFMNSVPIGITLKVDDNTFYSGEGIIIDFPLNTKFDNAFKYSLKIMGTGKLEVMEK